MNQAIAMNLQPGQIIDGRYCLSHQAGEGGCAEVWKVFHRSTGHAYAIKFLRPETMLQVPHAVERFEREATITKTLSHPHIIQCHEHGVCRVDGGVELHYQVLPWLDGNSLAFWIEYGFFREYTALEKLCLFIDIAAAAQVITDHGVIHRDFKASNIVYDPRSGHITIVDFGAAYYAGAGRSSAPRVLLGGFGGQVERYTKPGALFGSLECFAPESIRGAEPAATIDVYALGVLLYFLLMERLPYPVTDLHSTLTAHTTAPIPPIEGLPEGDIFDRELSKLVEQAMCKDPSCRFQTPGALHVAVLDTMALLEECLHAPPTTRLAGFSGTSIAQTSLFHPQLGLRGVESGSEGVASIASHGPAFSGEGQALIPGDRPAFVLQEQEELWPAHMNDCLWREPGRGDVTPLVFSDGDATSGCRSGWMGLLGRLVLFLALCGGSVWLGVWLSTTSEKVTTAPNVRVHQAPASRPLVPREVPSQEPPRQQLLGPKAEPPDAGQVAPSPSVTVARRPTSARRIQQRQRLRRRRRRWRRRRRKAQSQQRRRGQRGRHRGVSFPLSVGVYKYLAKSSVGVDYRREQIKKLLRRYLRDTLEGIRLCVREGRRFRLFVLIGRTGRVQYVSLKGSRGGDSCGTEARIRKRLQNISFPRPSRPPLRIQTTMWATAR